MAWTSSSTTNRGLISNLMHGGIIKSAVVERAMNMVDRKFYVRQGKDPYQDAPQSIGFGATISAPHMHAWCLELLHHKLGPTARALDVGSGSGYFTALMAATMVANTPSNSSVTGKVFGVEHIEDLVQWSNDNIKGDPSGMQPFVELFAGDGRKGIPTEAPFDAIHVGAASLGMPMELIAQLQINGRMVVPVEAGGHQQLMVIDKTGPGADEYVTQKVADVRYVPLTDRSHYS